MKIFLRILMVIGIIAAGFAAAGMISRVFRTRMTRYYKVY